jgi:sugar phosphate isomerase/epimerase
MKFAFSTVACPKWDFVTIAARAKEYGYDGVELRASPSDSNLSAANIFLSDPPKIKTLFDNYGLAIACLSSSIAMTGNKRQDKSLADECRRFIDTARQLGCPLVKVFDSQVEPGGLLNPLKLGNHSRASVAVELGDWLAPLGDYAAGRDICLVVENAMSFRSSKEMWMILERLSHPAIACCWDLFNAALIGEGPAVSIPTLNSRIQFVQVKDARLGPLGASLCKLGEGDVPVKKLMIRLLGIGYTSWVSFEWEKAWLPNIAEPEEILPDAIKKLREWSEPPKDEEPAKKEHAAAH